jgi:hypothetical protein
MKTRIALISLLLTLLATVPGLAEITLFVSPDVDGAFILEGDNAQGVESMDIVIGYDSSSLANPEVTTQGGTVTNVSANPPGMLSVSIARENPESSFELHLKFEKTSESPGSINYVSAVAVSTDGRNITAATDMRALSPPPPESQQDETENNAVSISRVNGTAEARKDAEGNEEKFPVLSDSNTGNSTPFQGEKAISASPVMSEIKSVLQRFKDYRGKKGLKEFAALFESRQNDIFVQDPPVVLSDGKTPVRVRLELQSRVGDPPNITLSDAKLVQLRKESEKGWVITVLPKEGTWNASLIITMDDNVIRIPLVVAPPVKIRKSIDEKNFFTELDRYVSDQGAGEKRKQNQLPRITDEYVFTANYLAGSGNRSRGMATEQAALMSSSIK